MAWSMEEAVSYYKTQGAPADQTALIGLLREVQQENGGGIPAWAIASIAECYGVKQTFLQAVIKRIPSLRLADTHLLELCAGPNCGKCTALASFTETLCKQKQGKITLKFVPCMRMCGKGPNIRWDGKLFHGAEESLLRSLTEDI